MANLVRSASFRTALFRAAATIGASALVAGVSASASAETLGDAIALAYQNNPTLQSARAQLRALDETYVQARAGWGLQVEADFLGEYDHTRAPNFLGQQAFTGSNTGQTSLTIAQPIYTGGRVAGAVSAAELSVKSGREQLRFTESQVLFSVVQAYADVLRDDASLQVRDQIVATLQRQLDETSARFSAGEVTRTDIAQAKAQLEAERVLRNQAAGQLQASRSEYTAAVGRNPETLAPPPPLAGIPAQVDTAFDMAESFNPQLREAQYTEEASRAQIEVARSAYRPTVTARASYYYTGSLVPAYANKYSNEYVGQVSISQPLFTAGTRSSTVRQRLEQNTSDRITIESTRRTLIQNVSNSWNSILVARQNIKTAQSGVDAAQAAFDGMQIEYRDGTRSTYDVLIAEETLRDAQLQLLGARHDDYVAGASLLAQLGLLEIRTLAPDVPAYDPKTHFRKVKHDGELPTDYIEAAVDSFARPGAGTRAVPEPPPAPTPVALASGAGDGPAPDAPLATFNPVRPAPGTAPDAARRPINAPDITNAK